MVVFIEDCNDLPEASVFSSPMTVERPMSCMASVAGTPVLLGSRPTSESCWNDLHQGLPLRFSPLSRNHSCCRTVRRSRYRQASVPFHIWDNGRCWLSFPGERIGSCFYYLCSYANSPERRIRRECKSSVIPINLALGRAYFGYFCFANWSAFGCPNWFLDMRTAIQKLSFVMHHLSSEHSLAKIEFASLLDDQNNPCKLVCERGFH